MRTCRHIASLLARTLLALALVGPWQLAALPAPDAWSAESSPSSADVASESGYEPVKLTLDAYKLLEDQDDFWDVKSGRQTTIAKRGGKLRVAVRAKWEKDGDSFSISQTKDKDWSDQGGFSEGFTYETSDADIARVDSQGIVTALGKKDGKVTITATPKNETYRSLTCSIALTVSNQETGLLATKLEIVNERGKAYGDDNVRITRKSQQVKLYVRATFTDSDSGARTVYANYPGAPASQKPVAGVLDTLRWSVGDTNYASVSAHDGIGYLTGKANAVTQVFASLSGGDASRDYGMGYGVLVDYAGVTIDNGRTVNGMDPADKLTVNVVYEGDPGSVVTSRTYTPGKLEALGAITRNYTFTRNNGRYVTDRAYGVPLAKVLVDLKIETADVNYFTMAANDGANPGRITAKWLLRTTRYYLPNYDIGGSWQGRKQVPTMIALKDSWNEQTTLTGDLNTGTRFRLVFGSSTSADNATDKSIKFINTLTVVMKGAPPSRHGTGDGQKSTSAGTGSGTAAGNGTGTAGSGGSGTQPGPSTPGGSGGSGQSQAAQKAPPADSLADSAKNTSVKELDSSSRWRIYQMMNKSESDLIPLDNAENPLTPWALPAALALLALAMLVRIARYRRQMRW